MRQLRINRSEWRFFSSSLLLLAAIAVSGCAYEHLERPGQDLPSESVKFPATPGYDQVPVLQKGAAPVYPIEAALNADEGIAVISFVVGTDGHTHDLKILQATNEYFGNHLLIAASSWQFQPALMHGQPAEYQVRSMTWHYCAMGPGTSGCQ